MEDRGALRGGLAEAGDQVAAVFPDIEIEEVVVDLDAVAGELDRVAGGQVVVVDVEGAAALRDRPAGVLRDRDRAVADVVVDLHVLVVLEGEFDREVHLDRVVVDPAALPLAHLDPVELVLLVHLGAQEAVVGDLAVLHPDREDRAAGDAALDAGDAAALPAAAGVDELAVVDLRALHREGADAGPQDVLHAHMVEVQVRVAEAEDRAVELRDHAGSGPRS